MDFPEPWGARGNIMAANVFERKSVSSLLEFGLVLLTCLSSRM